LTLFTETRAISQLYNALDLDDSKSGRGFSGAAINQAKSYIASCS